MQEATTQHPTIIHAMSAKGLALSIAVSFAAAFGVAPTTQASTAIQSHSANNFQNWLVQFKKEARAQGISEKTLTLAFKNVKVDNSVLNSDRKQPEFSRTFF